MLKMLKLTSVILMSFMLFACQESNPFIGTWDMVETWRDSDGFHERHCVVEYKEDSMSSICDNGKTSNLKSRYNKISDTEWELILILSDGKEINVPALVKSGTLYSKSTNGRITKGTKRQ